MTRKTEIFSAVEYSLSGKCSDIIGKVAAINGFDLMRRLCMKYDPPQKNIFQMLQAKLFGLAEKKCADFKAVFERLELIDGLVREMMDQCAEQPTGKMLADIFYPSLDNSCISEIGSLRVMIGDGQSLRQVNTDSYDDLSEYVRQRQQRERATVPISTRKMDVSEVARQQSGNRWPDDSSLIPSQWHEPSYGTPWTDVYPQIGQDKQGIDSDHLDAMYGKRSRIPRPEENPRLPYLRRTRTPIQTVHERLEC